MPSWSVNRVSPPRIMASTLRDCTLSGFWEIRSHSSCHSCRIQGVGGTSQPWSKRHLGERSKKEPHPVSIVQGTYLVVGFTGLGYEALIVHHSGQALCSLVQPVTGFEILDVLLSTLRTQLDNTHPTGGDWGCRRWHLSSN